MDTMDWLKKLISFDTTSSKSNVELILTIQDYLQSYGIACRITYDEDKNKANLLAILPDKTNSLQKGLLLSGHTDVVPVDNQVWNTPPFVATRIGNKIYGRGASDMKGFIAVVLALVPQWVNKLSSPIYLAFTFDEEVGCKGIPLLLKDLETQDLQPEACIVGEPSELLPITAHKGIQAYQVTVNGKSAHSSLTPYGVNANEFAADLMVYIRNLGLEIEQSKIQDHTFDVPFTTLSINVVRGGMAFNTIPDICDFFFDCRYLPQTNPKNIIGNINQYVRSKLVPNMQKQYADANVLIKTLGAIPSFETMQSSRLSSIFPHLFNDEKKVKKVSYATEAGFFQQLGIPTVVWGPGSIQQAHAENEYILIEQLERCAKELNRIVLN